MPKKGSSYEQVVSQVVAGLSICKNGRVYRNRRYSGVSQPGEYEIDISFEFNVDGALYFLVIVECKDWSKPVDRPVVQQLIQTRDAIGAHKAAIASPRGFTPEARQVAEANGVACWEVSDLGDVKIVGAMHEAVGRRVESRRKPDSDKKIAVKSLPEAPDSLSIAWSALRRDFVRIAFEDLGLPDSSSGRRKHLDSVCVLGYVVGGWHEGELLNAFAQALIAARGNGGTEGPRLRAWIVQTEGLLCDCGMREEEAKTLVAAVCEKEFRSRLWKPPRFNDDSELNTSFLQEFERRHELFLATLRLPVPSSVMLLLLLFLDPAKLHSILASWQIEEPALRGGWEFWRVSGPTATLRRCYTKRMMLLLAAGPPILALSVLGLCDAINLASAPLRTVVTRLAVSGCVGIGLSQGWALSFAVMEALLVGVLAPVYTSNYLFSVYTIPFALGLGISTTFIVQNGFPLPSKILVGQAILLAAMAAAILGRDIRMTAISTSLFVIGSARLPLYPLRATHRFLIRLVDS